MYCSRTDRSKKSKGKQHTFSSTLGESLPRACGRSLRLIHCRAVPGTNNGDLYRRGDRSPFFQPDFYPTLDLARRVEPRLRPQLLDILQRRSRFWAFCAPGSQVQAANARVLSSFQIYILARFDAEMCSGVSREISPTLSVLSDFNVDFRHRLCLTFCDRLFPARFLLWHDRSSNVRQNCITNVTNQDEESTRSARLVRDNVPGRFGNLVSIPRAQSARGAAVRRVSGASLVFPNNCPQRRPYAELRPYRVRSRFARL